MEDISEFEKGQFVKSYSNMVYEIMDYKYEIGKRKMNIVASICRNIKTNEACEVTHGKNRHFELYNEKAAD